VDIIAGFAFDGMPAAVPSAAKFPARMAK
jgi:hypothetical protein